MRVLAVPSIRLNTPPGPGALDAALAAVFGPDMLRTMHGPDTVVGGFVNGKRTFGFKISVGEVPRAIRRFFCGSQLRITTRQTVDASVPDKYTVTNRLKLHFVGAELFKLRPVFWLERAPDGAVHLGGRVRHDALLPPPLNGIAEGFMMLNSQKELLNFAGCLHDAGLIDSIDVPPPAAPTRAARTAQK
jgi:hypothetical protein